MEIMDSGEKVALLWRMVAATQANKVKWEAVDEFAFRTRVGRFGYVVSSQDRDDFAPFVFQVYRFNAETNEAELLDEWNTQQYSPLNDPLQALYLEVKRGVNGLASVVSEIFEDLASIDGGPAGPNVPQASDPF